jgi:hypothetical protein
LCNQLFDELMRTDFHTKRLPLPCVVYARVATGANEPGGTRRNRVAPLIEGEHRDLEPFSLLTDQVLNGNLYGVHLEMAGVPREDPPLLGQGSARKPFERAFNDEGTHAGGIALLLLLEIRPREHEEVVGNIGERDPHLLARELVTIAFLDRNRLDAASVAAR